MSGVMLGISPSFDPQGSVSLELKSGSHPTLCHSKVCALQTKNIVTHNCCKFAWERMFFFLSFFQGREILYRVIRMRFEDIYVSSPGSMSDKYGRDYFVCTGPASILEPVTESW